MERERKESLINGVVFLVIGGASFVFGSFLLPCSNASIYSWFWFVIAIVLGYTFSSISISIFFGILQDKRKNKHKDI